MVTKRFKLAITGKVQGVFFRDFAKQNANKLGLVGYAKNLRNGVLEIVVQGEEAKLQGYVKLCKSGPMFAEVKGVDVSELQIDYLEEYEFFDIRPT